MRSPSAAALPSSSGALQGLASEGAALNLKLAIDADEHGACSPSASPKDKRKKKKKKNRGDKTSSNEEKLQKSFTFPSSSSCPIPPGNRRTLEFEDAHDFKSSSPTSLGSMPSSCPASFFLRSALRGGRECLGLGPRPKLHVKWAAGVQDPPSSTVSHTVNYHQNSFKAKKKQTATSNKSKSKSKQQKKSSKGNLSNSPPVVEADEKPPEENADTPFLDKSFAAQAKTFFGLMELGTKHVQFATKFANKVDLSAALAEYKSALCVFRMARADAESVHASSVRDRELGLKQAIQAEVLALISMATLYSTKGSVAKSQAYHELALGACRDFGVKLNKAENELYIKNCSMVALSSSSSGACEHLKDNLTVHFCA